MARHLPSAPSKVLDLAGGDGADALRLARRGHDVTVVDRSAEMLAEAERSFASAGLPVRVVRADLTDPAEDVGGEYDVVLVHNVIQYTADQVVGWLDGCAVLGHYGICTVTGYVADNARKHDPAFFADLERLELALADRMPYPLIARFFHLVVGR
ncbi:hypothetical protein ALI22I_43295 [Saccharothrix sp. ALI-22-I]|uniref:class I SAM-dependent methyltransferase n=1 Tax=Saccharothrix sp. ALI-22-I TaxID=1933778 RepID=UPI00097C9F4C|nr:class I SAM-dependent methyltransferase [Saccharothrix sp. ALI-22-I]ONI80214.1 hypothetical protein ALI22I_43295 [Saccharothrix sp. ALI-22-I]